MDYTHFLKTKFSKQWERIGTERRAGICVPLFSLHSKKSTGIGEFRDLKLLIDWCSKNGLSIIQLLPLNDTGSDFAPYNSESSFALDPVYLTVGSVKKIRKNFYGGELKQTKELFSCNSEYVNYGIKSAKIEILKKYYLHRKSKSDKKFKQYKEKNMYWLKDYALFKVLKFKFKNKNWEDWDSEFKLRDEKTLESLGVNYRNVIDFFYWVQWQAYLQFRDVKKYAEKKGIKILGDLPYLVSRDSADVWANQKYFKLNLVSGAPPDVYFSKGQRWGMPPYNWEEIERDNFDYLKGRFKYAEKFYDMFRIDHFVGLLRVWTIELDTPESEYGLTGRFDPADANLWKSNAEKILNVISECTGMLPCAEDLGTVPYSSFEILEQYGIPGIEIQRWKKFWDGNNEFVSPEEYRSNSVSSVSTHDSSFFPVWWKYEAGTIDESLFLRLLEGIENEGQGKDLIYGNLFNPDKSRNSRLYWKDNITGERKISDVLGEHIPEINTLYSQSYKEKEKFLLFTGIPKNNADKISTKIVEKSLLNSANSNSVFNIESLFEYLFLDDEILKTKSNPDFRINFPGTVSYKNWSLRLPIPLEKLKKLNLNEKIKILIKETRREPGKKKT